MIWLIQKKKVKSGISLHFSMFTLELKTNLLMLRFKTRDLNGQKVLTVEEMQSDIVQDMKKKLWI